MTDEKISIPVGNPLKSGTVDVLVPNTLYNNFAKAMREKNVSLVDFYNEVVDEIVFECAKALNVKAECCLCNNFVPIPNINREHKICDKCMNVLETEKQAKIEQSHEVPKKKETIVVKTFEANSDVGTLIDEIDKYHSKKKPSILPHCAKPTIQTVQGLAKYYKTEIEDEHGNWNDNYSTNNGFYVIHNGKYHDVYTI